jgi:hypothetical protein
MRVKYSFWQTARISLRQVTFLPVLLSVNNIFLFPEFFLEDYADALGVQGGAGEVSVVALVIYFQGNGSVGGQDILQAEVADEVLGVLHDVVSVAELPVEDKAVVEHSAAEKSFVFSIAESVCTRSDIGSN